MGFQRHWQDNSYIAQQNKHLVYPSPTPPPPPPPLPPRHPFLHTPPSYSPTYEQEYSLPLDYSRFKAPYPDHIRSMANTDAEGYLLLTIPEATIGQIFDGEKMDLGRGELAVECVSVPIPPEIGHQTANPFEVSPNDPAPTHDMWLVLRIGDNFEHTLVPGNAMEARSPPGGDGGPTYILRNPDVPGAELVLSLEAPRSLNELEDLGTLESLFRQYGVLPSGSGLDGVQAPSLGHRVSFGDSKSGFGAPAGQPPTYASTEGAGPGSGAYHDEKSRPGVGAAAAGAAGFAGAAGASTMAGSSSSAQTHQNIPLVHGGSAEDLRGKLVLVDETTGAVIGEMDHAPKMSDAEAADVANQEPTRPVMIDFGPIVAHTREVRVTRIPPDEIDGWMLKGADFISRGVLGASSAASGAMMRSAERYRAKAVPRPEPVRMGAVTSSLKSVHGATTAGARVTGKTVGMINNQVERLVSKKQKGGQVYAAPQPGAAGPAGFVPQKSTFQQIKEAAVPAATSAYGWAKTQAQQRGYLGGAPGGTGTHAPGTTTPGGGAYGADHGAPYGTAGGQAPPLPPRIGTEKASAAAGPGQGGSPLTPNQPSPGGYNEKSSYSASTYGAAPGVPLGTTGNTHLGPGYTSSYPDEKSGYAPPLSPAGSAPGSGYATPTGKKKKRPLLNRTILAADVILSSFEAAANELVTSGTHAASTAVGARYGNDAGAAVAYTGASVRNAVLVYVDVRGVGRRSILKATAKGWVKARMKNGEEVRLQPVAPNQAQPTYKNEEGHVVVGVPVAPEKK
ncbi:hypothetical protein CC85DRAFT_329775 [Cutaneotrichosporon oleaginosum]|uniref:Senescence domain-containing protein n=1 Tax=Cutaneotrichosporon oleaginosum TaxID=879819 RepID=A0A0J1AZ50_9TREE|nr:uncharacterized protein CC85DRAFT_329775 [Cutaneotrichosporon oleaginosum]KLT40609.1 hypothetical protein CC85DRAFT_329775 [Cutaneotrichosporon oleaginosum]TXT03932.1 hypothetical protein COLE_07629 [Cutaneotrichosporon oleaginosum]